MRSALATVDSSAAQIPRERAAHDFYIEERWFVEALFDAEKFNGYVWDPACGTGTILRVAATRGHITFASDLVQRGAAGRVQDFLTTNLLPSRGLELPIAIVCNPPFKLADRFVKHALDLGADTVAMLLRWSYAEGGSLKTEGGRLHSWCLDEAPLARLYVAVNRVSMPPGDVAVEAKGGALAFGWFVWERAHKGPATFYRLRKPT